MTVADTAFNARQLVAGAHRRGDTSGWGTYVIDALESMGRQAGRLRLYERRARRYLRQRGQATRRYGERRHPLEVNDTKRRQRS